MFSCCKKIACLNKLVGLMISRVSPQKDQRTEEFLTRPCRNSVNINLFKTAFPFSSLSTVKLNAHPGNLVPQANGFSENNSNSANLHLDCQCINVQAWGGTVSSAQTICSGTSPDNLTLSGHAGTVIVTSSPTVTTTFTNACACLCPVSPEFSSSYFAGIISSSFPVLPFVLHIRSCPALRARRQQLKVFTKPCGL